MRYLLCWWRVAQYTCLEQQLKIEVMSWSFGVFTCSRYATVIRMASVFFQKYFTVWKLRNFTCMISYQKIPWNQQVSADWLISRNFFRVKVRKFSQVLSRKKSKWKQNSWISTLCYHHYWRRNGEKLCRERTKAFWKENDVRTTTFWQ